MLDEFFRQQEIERNRLIGKLFRTAERNEFELAIPISVKFNTMRNEWIYQVYFPMATVYREWAEHSILSRLNQTDQGFEKWTEL